MTTQQDCSVGISAAETTYGTYAAAARHFEFTDESFMYKPEFVQGKGLRVGAVTDRVARRSTGMISAEGDLEVELCSKGLGVLFTAALGSSVSTLVSGAAYQQLHTPTTTDLLPSYTIQKGVPPVGGGATSPHSFPGAMCKSLELEAKQGEIVSLKTSWMARTLDTASAYVAPTYPAAPELFTFVHGAIVIGGTVVPPTTTTLATGGTVAANITDFKLKYDNGLDDGGYTFGNGGMKGRKGVLGLRSITGSITAEYTDNVLRDAFIAQTNLALVMTFQTQSIISGAIKPTYQVTCPLVRLEGDTPSSNAGKVVTVDHDFTGLDGGVAASPIYIACLTSDTAI